MSTRPEDEDEDEYSVAPTVHCGIELLQTADEVLMDTLQADKRTSPYILRRLSPTVAVVTPGGVDKLAAALEKAGHLARVVPSSGFEDWRNRPAYEAGGDWDDGDDWDVQWDEDEDDDEWDEDDEDWDEDDE